MKPRSLTFLALALVVYTGCDRSPQSSREGPQGKKISVAVTDNTFSITQNENKQFSVTVTRENLNGPIQLKFDLPEGLKIKEPEAEWSFDKETKQKFFTLYAKKNAKPQKETEIRVSATHESMDPVGDNLRVEIVESLESKKARQNEFAKKMDGKLVRIKKDLQAAGEQIMKKVKDPGKKAGYLKRAAELYKNLDEARKKYDALAAAPVETWEQKKQEVENAVNSLEHAVARFGKEIKSAK